MQRNSKVGLVALSPIGPADEYEAAFWQNWRTQLRLVMQKPWLAATWLKQSHTLLERFNRIYSHLCRQPRHVRRRLQRQLGASLAGAALALALLNAPAYAANIDVDGATCTLVDAITAANTDTATGGCAAGSGDDIIGLQSDVALTAVNNGTGGGDTGLPVISSVITIEGAGYTISRDAGAPGFRLLVVDASGNLTLHSTTLSGGSVSGYNGAGILNYGMVTLNSSTLSGNTATNNGGGIYNGSTGTAIVNNSTLAGNSASMGGGINNQGTVTLNNSILSGNTATNNGGGIYNKAGTATLNNSTLSGNSASMGGGINNQGTATLNNSTLSGNTATNNGGGINNKAGTATLNNSTLSGNTANYGGGIYNESTVTLDRSLLSGNTAPDGAEIYNYGGTVNAASFNLIGHDNNAGSDNFTPSGSDIVPSQALAAILAPLTDNGGGLLTHALVTGSPAIDAAGDSGLGTDQRGFIRPQGAADDIGAFEALPTNVSFNGGDCNLSDAIAAANQDRSYGACNPGVAGADTITLLGDITLLTTNFNSSNYNSLTPVTSTVTIEGAGFTLARDAAATDPFGLLVVLETGDLTLNDITLTGAYSKYGALASIGQLTVNDSTITGNTGAVLGGGLFNVGTATLNNSSVTNNNIVLPYAIPFIGGGGIANWIGTLTLNNSLVSSNSSASFAGAVNNTKYGTLTVNESTLTQNTAAYGGGAIFSYAGAGVSVTNSTISNNDGTAYAGGLGGIATPILVTNSTVSNNQADVGGGFFLVDDSSFTMANSTVTGNTGTTSGGGIATDYAMLLTGNLIAGNISPEGAEIVDGVAPSLARRGFLKSANTLTQKMRAQLAKSPFLQHVQALVDARKAAQSQSQTVQSAAPNPVGGSLNLFGHSGLTTAEAFEGFVPAGSDLVATSDGTLPTALTAILNTTLADNGGPKAGLANEPILTHALAPGSPAIDAAGDSGLDTDQRGVARPQGTADDIGAVEINDWVNVNSHLALQGSLTTSFSANPDGTYGAQSPAGVFTINATFRNIANPAVGLRNVYFQVTSIININSIDNYLLNADSGPGQVGSIVSVANSTFGADSLWNQGEDLPMTFQIGLMERRRFAFFVDVYGIVDVAAAGVGTVQHLGSFQFTLDPTENIVRTIFLPVVVKE